MYMLRYYRVTSKVLYNIISFQVAYVSHQANNFSNERELSPTLEEHPKENVSDSIVTGNAPTTKKFNSAESYATRPSSAVVTTWDKDKTSLSISVNSCANKSHQLKTNNKKSNYIGKIDNEINAMKGITRSRKIIDCDDNNKIQELNETESFKEEHEQQELQQHETHKINEATGHLFSRYDSSNSSNDKMRNHSLEFPYWEESFTEPIKRIILVRNGLSEANMDVSKYVTMPDWRIPIVEEGKKQAIKAGRALASLTSKDPIYFYYSPYIRSRQSLRYILQGILEQNKSSAELPHKENLAITSNANNKYTAREQYTSNSNNSNNDNNTGSSITNINNSTSNSSERNEEYKAKGSECNVVCHTRLSENDTARENLFEACEFHNEIDHILMKETSHTNLSPSSSLSSIASAEENSHLLSFDSSNERITSDGEEQRTLLKEQKDETQTDTRASPAELLLSRSFDNVVGVREDVRLRDGDIGRYNSVDELLHHLQQSEKYGQFFYRFPHGESGADVCDRVTSFLDAFQRERITMPMNTNVVIVTHGLAIRMFIARWFHLTVDTFHKMRSPPPGSICTLTRICHQSRFRLNEECLQSMRLPASLNDKNGYKYRNKQLLGSLSSGAPYM